MRGSRLKAQVWRAQRTFHVIACDIFMRSCCVFDSPRLSLPLLVVHFPSHRPLHLPGLQLLLPRCGVQIPCALSLMRTLAPLPSTTLSQHREGCTLVVPTRSTGLTQLCEARVYGFHVFRLFGAVGSTEDTCSSVSRDIHGSVARLAWTISRRWPLTTCGILSWNCSLSSRLAALRRRNRRGQNCTLLSFCP